MGRLAFVSSRLSEFRSALNATCRGLLARSCQQADRLGRYQRSLRVAFWALLGLVSFGVVLDLGIWRSEDATFGPFRVATNAPGQSAIDIGQGVPIWLRIRLVEDRPFANPPASVRLSRDGQTIGSPAQLRPRISPTSTSWLGLGQRELTFSLPDGVANDNRLRMAASYTVTYHRTFNDIVLTFFILVLTFRLIQARHFFARALRQDEIVGVAPAKTFLSGITTATPFLFSLLSILIVMACVAYAATIAYGVAAGHALPTADAFHLVPGGWLSAGEPYLPAAILVFAAAGALLAWAASFGAFPVETIRQTETTLARIWGWWALPVILSLLLISLSAGGWSGNIRAQDANYVSLAGLIPHSDARAYFTDAYQLAIAGDWGVLGSRRPLAEAFRQLTVIAGRYSYVGTLLVQVALMSVALLLAARSVTLRYGIWAGIGFVGLIYLANRVFLPTTLTEPAGLVWGLFATAFFLEAFRLKSLPHAFVGLAALTIALVSRMGSMFTIPALAVWMGCAFASSWGRRIRLFAGACAVIAAVLVLNLLCALLYASPGVATGSNFAFTLCGLSLGTNWSDCTQHYAAELQKLPTERSQALFLLSMAWQNFVENPKILVFRLVENAFKYFAKLPELLFEGPWPGEHVPGSITKIGAFGLLVSAVVCNRLRGSRAENVFWILLFVSIGASAAVILADDGRRALHATHVLVACFFAAGFSAPVAVVARARIPKLGWQTGAAVVVVAGILFVVAPKVSNLFAAQQLPALSQLEAEGTDGHIVLGGRHLAGFVVIPDGEPRPTNLPALHRSQFMELLRFSDWEGDFGPIVDGELPSGPFAFVMGVRPYGRVASNIYVAPASVLDLTDVCMWRFAVRPRWRADAPTSSTFFDVVHAEKFVPAGGKQRCGF